MAIRTLSWMDNRSGGQRTWPAEVAAEPVHAFVGREKKPRQKLADALDAKAPKRQKSTVAKQPASQSAAVATAEHVSMR